MCPKPTAPIDDDLAALNGIDHARNEKKVWSPCHLPIPLAPMPYDLGHDASVEFILVDDVAIGGAGECGDRLGFRQGEEERSSKAVENVGDVSVGAQSILQVAKHRCGRRAAPSEVAQVLNVVGVKLIHGHSHLANYLVNKVGEKGTS
jgi:hypothetical protein